jgi:hypothetical protein
VAEAASVLIAIRRQMAVLARLLALFWGDLKVRFSILHLIEMRTAFVWEKPPKPSCCWRETGA